MKRAKFVCTLLAALLAIAIIPAVVDASESAKPKIMVIVEHIGYGPFVSGVSAYGDTMKVRIGDAAKYTLEYLRQFDVFVAESFNGAWGYFPELVGKIGTLIYEGKSLIVLITTRRPSPSPADAWVSVDVFETPLDWVEYEVIPSDLTRNVKGIKGSCVKLFLYGGYPLILSPKRPGYPEPRGALAVYGYHGKGKYAVLSEELWDDNRVKGDVGTLFSNIMYWLINREIPPPPTVMELDRKVAEINKTLNALNLRLLELKRSMDKLYSEIRGLYHEIPRLKDVPTQLDKLSRQLNDLTDRFNDLNVQFSQNIQQMRGLTTQMDGLSYEVERLKKRPQDPLTYMAIPAILLSMAAIVIASKRRRVAA